VNAIVDTNVIAYYVLGTEPFAEETKAFWRAVEKVYAPSLWAAEFANVVWMAIRAQVLAPDEGHQRLQLAARLGIRSVPIRSVWQGALGRATTADVTVYDTLFVELATRRRLPLVTFDAKLLKAFPDVAHRPGSLLAN
jgi:predicted nucleic acid-binding protein